jgi:hypothetical protein
MAMLALQYLRRLAEPSIFVAIASTAMAAAVWCHPDSRAPFNAEATMLLQGIAGQQESYRAEFRRYCNVNSPAPTAEPDASEHDWRPERVHGRWKQLGFVLERPTIYSFDTIAGVPGETAMLGELDRWILGGVRIEGSRNHFVAGHWFVARAVGDIDGDRNRSLFWITHQSREVRALRAEE